MRKCCSLKVVILVVLLIIPLAGCNFSGIIDWVIPPSTIPETCDICNLPPYSINIKVKTAYLESHFIIELKYVGSDYDIYDGNWTGWCADKETSIETDEWYQGYVYCSYNPSNRYGIDWPKVNWIINNKGYYSAEYIQNAIWHFTNGYPPNGLAMAAEAHLDFCPQSGQKYIAIIDVPGKQLTFIEVPVEQNKTEYRAFLVGVGDYENFDFTNGDLVSPSYDVDRVHQVLNQCKFGSLNTEFSSILELKDTKATKSAILQGIESTFAGADSNDISYFYFRGHGFRGNDTSYLCPTDSKLYDLPYIGIIGESSLISVDELEKVLSSIPGIKVVLLDCCYSGGFIGKGESVYDELVEFNDNVIYTFSQSLSKDPLTNNQYKVLCSCSYNQTSISCEDIPIPPEEVAGDVGPSEPIPGIENVIEGSYGYFTAAFCVGCGYDEVYPYPADSNMDTCVSIYEIYNYIKFILSKMEQDIQIYADYADFVIAEY